MTLGGNMKKIVTLVCTLAMALTLGACSSGGGEEAAQEQLSPADQLLVDVSGTYDELFTVICDPQYDQLWIDDCAAVVGEDMAADVADMLKAACTGTIYGDEAAAAYAENPEAVQFDCSFINGLAQITFDGNTISGVGADGNQVFSHEYAYVQDLQLGGMMDGYLYATEDADAGEFTYFFMMPDTPASTYHIEFRYGSDIDALTQYAEGPYAYWLAAGILTDADDQMIQDVIGLFCEENLADMGEEEAQAA